MVHEPMKSPIELVIQPKSNNEVNAPASQPHQNACFQDALDHNKNKGIKAMNDTKPASSVGNARLSSNGLASDAPSAYGHAKAVCDSLRPRALSVPCMTQTIRRWGAKCLVACIIAVTGLGCGRGPVTPPPIIASTATIQFQLYVNGQITPGQGNYIIAINANTDPSTNVNVVSGENPGMPTAQEAQGTPKTFTHWDQQFIFGSSSGGATNGFFYNYKILTGGAGTSTVTWFPIVLNTNDFQLITNGSFGTGSGNVLSFTMPLVDLSIRANPNSSNPPTITTPPVTFLYVNYITTDTLGIPQDQLGPDGLGTIGYALPVDITHANTVQLPNFSAATGPSNPNLFIIGGQITVTE